MDSDDPVTHDTNVPVTNPEEEEHDQSSQSYQQQRDEIDRLLFDEIETGEEFAKGTAGSDEDTVYDSPTLPTPTNENQEGTSFITERTEVAAVAQLTDTTSAGATPGSTTTTTEPRKEKTEGHLPNHLLKYLNSEILKEETEEEDGSITEENSCIDSEDCHTATSNPSFVNDEFITQPTVLPFQKNEQYHVLNQMRTFLSNNRISLTSLLLTVASLVTRFYAIGRSKKVVWDEAHFGKFGSFYLRHEFYFDVHPPLGKMLVGLSGYLANYDGQFPFESGKDYPADLDITTMRSFNALWGALLVPLAFGTGRNLGFSTNGSVLAALFVLCDSALLTISRFVLLDSMLLFFTALSFYCLTGLRQATLRCSLISQQQKKNNYYQLMLTSNVWWAWLFGLGLSLGCVLSVKWVGLFAVALAGLYTVQELWNMFGDVSMPKKWYAGHWLARAICLILVPASIYVASFAVHFGLLHQSGPGDSTMSSLFQATLNGSDYSANPIEVAFGSNVTIKNYAYGGALLHSHPHAYPGGSKQQQITCYGHKDKNNHWQIRFPREKQGASAHYHYDDEAEPVSSEKLQFVKHDDTIRLFHVATSRNLHSHPIQAPLSRDQWEVSAYGNEKVGDVQDHWKVEIVESGDHDKQQLKALTTRFRLRHVRLGCYLASKGSILPEWGYKQHEVFCDRRSKSTDKHTWWNIEEHHHTEIPPPPPNTYRSNFWEDFWRLNVAMWNTNNALVPDADKHDILSSSPIQWPLLTVGLRMCSWDPRNIKFYLIGTPAVWWSATGAIICFAIAFLVYHIQYQRQSSASHQYGNNKSNSSSSSNSSKNPKLTIDTAMYEKVPQMLEKTYSIQLWWPEFKSAGCLIFGGWFLHYMPFYMMGRVTYLHHYFPALYFSVFMVPFMVEHAVKHYSLYYNYNSPRLLLHAIYAIITVLVIANFIHFSPFSYGMTGDIKKYASRRWFERWNLIENLH